MIGKIINWEFKEIKDESRHWVRDKINMLMITTIFKTTKGTYYAPCFVENKEMGIMMDLIMKELKLNLKLQHGILK